LDLTQIVNVILTQDVSSSSLRSSANSDYELSLSDLHLNYADGERSGNIILSMTNPNPVIALNWDLILPEGVSIDSDNLNFTGSRTNRNRHTIAINRLNEENKYIIAKTTCTFFSKRIVHFWAKKSNIIN
jgi:hypothetical protein